MPIETELKKRVENCAITRLNLAGLLEIAYSSLSAKLNGFASWGDGEREKLIAILDKQEKFKLASTASAARENSRVAE